MWVWSFTQNDLRMRSMSTMYSTNNPCFCFWIGSNLVGGFVFRLVLHYTGFFRPFVG
jgi:hypothetical protein